LLANRFYEVLADVMHIAVNGGEQLCLVTPPSFRDNFRDEQQSSSSLAIENEGNINSPAPGCRRLLSWRGGGRY
jgi:hypothetical protein